LNDLFFNEIAVNELPYNLLCRAIEYDTLPFCEEQGIGVIGYMAMLQGILADIYPSLDDVPVWQRRIRHFNFENNPECRHGESGAEDETNAALKSIREICHRTGYTMPEIAVKWILGNPAITCTLAGSRNTRELEANVKAIQEPLSGDIKAELDQVTSPLMERLGNHFDYYESAENDRTL
jgi:aryl-alcohol dehydrogenase-like predicted oxidoreductase